MQACLTTVKSALEVNGDNVVPLLLGHVEYHAVAQDAGAAHHDVQPAEVVDGRLHDALAAVHGGHGLGAGDGGAAGVADFANHQLGDGLVKAGAVHVHAGVNHHDFRAFFRHQHGDAAAHAAAGAGDDGYFSFQIVGHGESILTFWVVFTSMDRMNWILPF